MNFKVLDKSPEPRIILRSLQEYYLKYYERRAEACLRGESTVPLEIWQKLIERTKKLLSRKDLV
jgi:hypothetical protein